MVMLLSGLTVFQFAQILPPAPYAMAVLELLLFHTLTFFFFFYRTNVLDVKLNKFNLAT